MRGDWNILIYVLIANNLLPVTARQSLLTNPTIGRYMANACSPVSSSLVGAPYIMHMLAARPDGPRTSRSSRLRQCEAPRR